MPGIPHEYARPRPCHHEASVARARRLSPAAFQDLCLSPWPRMQSLPLAGADVHRTEEMEKPQGYNANPALHVRAWNVILAKRRPLTARNKKMEEPPTVAQGSPFSPAALQDLLSLLLPGMPSLRNGGISVLSSLLNGKDRTASSREGAVGSRNPMELAPASKWP